MNSPAITIGIQIEPELKSKLDQLAQSLGKSSSTCGRDAIALYVEHFTGDGASRLQSTRLRPQTNGGHLSEQVPDWIDWTT